MNKPDGLAYAIIGGVALTQLFFGLSLAIFPGWPKVGEWLNHGTAAAWAQAIMAFLAILSGAGVIAWQVQRQAAMEFSRNKSEMVRRLQTLNHSIFMLRIQLVMLKSMVRRGASHKKHIANVMRTVQRLEQVPLLELPTVTASHAVFNCISATNQLHARMDEVGSLINDSVLTHLRVETIDIALRFVTDSESEILGELAKEGAEGLGQYFDFEGKRYVNGVIRD